MVGWLGLHDGRSDSTHLPVHVKHVKPLCLREVSGRERTRRKIVVAVEAVKFEAFVANQIGRDGVTRALSKTSPWDVALARHTLRGGGGSVVVRWWRCVTVAVIDAGRRGSKGIVSKILPIADMPCVKQHPTEPQRASQMHYENNISGVLNVRQAQDLIAL